MTSDESDTRLSSTMLAGDDATSDISDGSIGGADYYDEEGVERDEDYEDVEDDDEDDEDDDDVYEDEDEDEEEEEEDVDDVSDLEADEYDDYIDDETLLERVAALREIIPAPVRHFASRQTERAINAGWMLKSTLGAIAWMLSTSALMIGVPLVIEMEREQQFVQYEREMQLQQQSLQPMAPGQTVAAPSSHNISTSGINPLQAPGVVPASTGSAALPAGF